MGHADDACTEHCIAWRVGGPLQGMRHQRATGAALSVAVALLETCARGDGGHVLLLAGGPCTMGPGQIVSRDYAEALRTHKDLEKGAAKFFAPAAAFYDGMAHRLIENGQALDVFASCLDQVRPRCRSRTLQPSP